MTNSEFYFEFCFYCVNFRLLSRFHRLTMTTNPADWVAEAKTPSAR
ncbi:hypothetical protein [Campylobacter troglodytis]|nr:hypothetical protein [Campylobacter troglodytis]